MSAARIAAIVDQAPAVEEPAVPVAVPSGTCALELEDVHFAWPGQARPVLAGASLRVAPGERVAIRGDSGGGKSTLSLLVLRQADPDRGRVLWGGQDLRRFALADWHARLAWMPQAAPVFAGTIAGNLRLGDASASDGRLWQVLAAVRLEEWARGQGGLGAWVGENGATLSGGQARRLALARALLRPGPLVLLDEPTEGLDEPTASALLQDLATALDGRSLLMITHDALPPGVVDRQYRLQDGVLQALA